MTSRKFFMVSFDVDRTLFRKPALTSAARGLGIAERWDALDQMEEKKRISIGQCLLGQFKLLVGMKVEDILSEVSKVEMMRNIRETVEKLLGMGLQVILTTDNPDFLCQYLVERFGFNGFVSSKVAVKNGIVTDDIEPLPDKRLGIRKYCAWMSVPLSKVVHVGDGPNDVPVFRVVGYSIALNTTIDKVKKASRHRMETDDLLDVYRHIHSLMPS
ncbi:MAG TPA: HAD hydrolase family protein [Candidatus Dormibacteraeota bacterium]|nr:HAD hydrolase family protein [Candidatus Dormibacteraeota bacterium]